MRYFPSPQKPQVLYFSSTWGLGRIYPNLFSSRKEPLICCYLLSYWKFEEMDLISRQSKDKINYGNNLEFSTRIYDKKKNSTSRIKWYWRLDIRSWSGRWRRVLWHYKHSSTAWEFVVHIHLHLSHLSHSNFKHIPLHTYIPIRLQAHLPRYSYAYLVPPISPPLNDVNPHLLCSIVLCIFYSHHCLFWCWYIQTRFLPLSPPKLLFLTILMLKLCSCGPSYLVIAVIIPTCYCLVALFVFSILMLWPIVSITTSIGAIIFHLTHSLQHHLFFW